MTYNRYATEKTIKEIKGNYIARQDILRKNVTINISNIQVGDKPMKEIQIINDNEFVKREPVELEIVYLEPEKKEPVELNIIYSDYKPEKPAVFVKQ